jgi:hypothetical protein
LKYAQQQRLVFIDSMLDYYGTLNRSALMDYFAISTPQASRDIRDYLALAPGNAVYDKSAKAYVRGAEFKRLYP